MCGSDPPKAGKPAQKTSIEKGEVVKPCLHKSLIISFKMVVATELESVTSCV
jgi:hypothetical protein